MPALYPKFLAGCAIFPLSLPFSFARLEVASSDQYSIAPRYGLPRENLAGVEGRGPGALCKQGAFGGSELRRRRNYFLVIA